MSGAGIAARIGGKLFGRFFARILGPLGLALTIGECTYLGLKYSGTLDKFNNLYCNRCRREIPRASIDQKARTAAIGNKFTVACGYCREPHEIEKIGEPCVYCHELLPSDEIDHIAENLTAGAHFTIRCPKCKVINNLHKI